MLQFAEQIKAQLNRSLNAGGFSKFSRLALDQQLCAERMNLSHLIGKVSESPMMGAMKSIQPEDF